MTDANPLDSLLNRVHCLDCFDLMARLPDKSIDLIATDLCYGTTACAWDTIIPFAPMWDAVKRILKPRGVFVTTASQPFTSALVMSNVKWFREELIWVKQHPKGFLDARRKHLDAHEAVLIFSQIPPLYNPQGLRPVSVKNGRANKSGNVYGKVGNRNYVQTIGNFPRSVLRFDAITQNNQHNTQKPVALYDYLIRTYTQPGEIVLDFCAGSGTTAIAARQTGRHFIIGDSSPEYCAIAQKRLDAPYTLPMMALLEG